MLKLYQSILLLLFVIRLSNGSQDNTSNLLNLYDLKVKNNEASCRLVNHPNLPEIKRTLAGRGCMCDEDCVKYKDCCKDSPYYRANEQSSPPEHQCSDINAVYLKAECPSEWEDPEMKELCEKSTKPLDSGDVFTIIPISNIKTRETYGNRHCAACHNDADEENWVQFPLGVICGEAPKGYLKPIKYEAKTTTSYDYPLTTAAPSLLRQQFSPQFTNKEPTYEIEKENCNHSCQVKVINNILTHPSPGIMLDIHLYVYNDTIINGGQWPVQLQTVSVDESNSILNNFLKRRKKRDSSGVIDFEKYSTKAPEICANAVYDRENKEFVSRYENKMFICRYGPKLPTNANLFTRRCVPQMERKCPDGYKDEAIKEECSIHTNVVYDKQTKKPYRNKDCARCHKKKEDSVVGTPPESRVDLSTTASTAPPPNPKVQDATINDPKIGAGG